MLFPNICLFLPFHLKFQFPPVQTQTSLMKLTLLLIWTQCLRCTEMPTFRSTFAHDFIHTHKQQATFMLSITPNFSPYASRLHSSLYPSLGGFTRNIRVTDDKNEISLLCWKAPQSNWVSVVIAVMQLLGNDPHQTNLFQSANVLIIMMKFSSLSQKDTVCFTHNIATIMRCALHINVTEKRN